MMSSSGVSAVSIQSIWFTSLQNNYVGEVNAQNGDMVYDYGISSPQDVAISPDGTMAVAVDDATSNILLFTKANTTDPVVTPFAESAIVQADGVAFAPNGNFFVSDHNPSSSTPSIYEYSIDLNTDPISISNVTSFQTATATKPSNLVVTPNGNYLIAVNTSSNSITVVNLAASTNQVATQNIVYNSTTFDTDVALGVSQDSSTVWIVSQNNGSNPPALVSYNLLTNTFTGAINLPATSVPDSISILNNIAYVGSASSSALDEVNLTNGSVNSINWTTTSGATGNINATAIANGGNTLYAAEANSCVGCSELGQMNLITSSTSSDAMTDLSVANLSTFNSNFASDVPINSIAISPNPASFEIPVTVGPVTANFYPVRNGSTSLNPGLVSSASPLYSKDYPNINFNPANTVDCSKTIQSYGSLTDVVPSLSNKCQELATSGIGFVANSCIQYNFLSNYGMDCIATDSTGDIMASNYNNFQPVAVDPGYALTSISCQMTPNFEIICVAGDTRGYAFEIGLEAIFPKQFQIFPVLGQISVANQNASKITAISCNDYSAVSGDNFSCVAVDSNGYAYELNETENFTGNSKLVSFSNAIWSISDSSNTFETSASNPTPKQIDPRGGVTGVSCIVITSVLTCVAVDDLGYVYDYISSAWGPAANNPIDTSGHGFTGISCYVNTQGFCVAVDDMGYMFEAAITTATTVTFNGWTDTSGVYGWGSGPYVSVDPKATLTGIDCYVMYYCIAVDDKGNVVIINSPLGQPGQTTVLAADANNSLVGVGCMPFSNESSGNPLSCLLFDDMGQVMTLSPPSNGSNWVSMSSVASSSINSVSCFSSTSCIGVDSNGDSYLGSFSDSTWNWQMYQTGIKDQLNSVSCAPAFCMAVGVSGTYGYTDNGKQWNLSGSSSISIANTLTSVSCVSSTFCVAVDATGYVWYFNGSIWQGWTGSAWAISGFQQVDSYSALNSISCRSSAFCVAVDAKGYVWYFNGSTWQGWTGSAWAKSGSFSPIENNFLNSVDCSNPSYCAIVDATGNLLTINPLNNSIVTNTIDSGNELTSVYCPENDVTALSSYLVASCLSADNNGDIQAIIYNDAGNATPKIIQATIGDFSAITSVTCATYFTCIAADKNGEIAYTDGVSVTATISNYNLNPGGQNGVLSNYQMAMTSTLNVPYPGKVDLTVGSNGPFNLAFGLGSSSSRPSVVNSSMPSIGSLSTGMVETGYQSVGEYNSVSISSISCSSSSFCMAVDSLGNVYSSGNQTAWSEPYLIDSGDGFTSISCADQTTSYCMAINGNGNAYYCSSNNCTSNPPIFSKSIVNPGDLLTSISCSSSSSCMAVDNNGNAFDYNGSSWALKNIDSTNVINSISCSTSSSCMAVDNNGNAILFKSGTWSSPVNIDSTNVINSISCSSASFCVAVDNNGNAFDYNGSSWAQTATTNEYVPLEAVSCVSSVACYATDTKGNVDYYNGTAWTVYTTISNSANSGTENSVNGLGPISCTSSSSACVAVDTKGDALVGGPSSWTKNIIWAVNGSYESDEISLYFPTAGTYPFELDYSNDLSGGQLGSISLGLGTLGAVSATTITPNCPVSYVLSNYEVPVGGNTPFIVCSTQSPFSDNGYPQRFSSFDGTPIDSEVTIPVVGHENLPLITLISGGTGTKNTLESTSVNLSTNYLGQSPPSTEKNFNPINNAYFAQQGYASLTYSPRGIGGSCGTYTPNMPFSTYSYLRDPNCKPVPTLSCPNSTTCIALDSHGNAVILRIQYSGTSIIGSAEQFYATGDANAFQAVSCYSSTTIFCAGVDDMGNIYYSNDAANSSPSAWTQVNTPYTYPMTAVDCVSVGICYGANSNGTLFYLNVTGTTTILESDQVDSNYSIDAIYCTVIGTGTQCLAGDSAGQTFVFDYVANNGSSGFSTNADPIVIYQTATGELNSQISIDSISCVSSGSLCVLGDNEGNVWMSTDAFSPPSSWTYLNLSQGPLVSAQCYSNSTCYLVDSSGNVFYSDAPSASPSSFSQYYIEKTKQIESTSCSVATTALLCAAVDNTGAFFTVTNPGASNWDAMTDNSVSCTNSSFCMEVDSQGNYRTYNGTSWSFPAVTGDSASLTSVSCSLIGTSNNCMAVDSNGNAILYSSGAWSSRVNIDSTNVINSVSCMPNGSTFYCMAVDDNRNYIYYNGTSWSTPTQLTTTASSEITSLSCYAYDACVAVDSGGNYYEYTAAGWSSPQLITGAGDLTAVSCVSVENNGVYCLSGNSQAQAFEINPVNSTDQSLGNADSAIGPTHDITSISCESTQLALVPNCAMVDSTGGYIAFNGANFYETDLDQENPLSSVSCVSSSVDSCFVLDDLAARGQIYDINQNPFSNNIGYVPTNIELTQESFTHLGDRRFEIHDLQLLISNLIEDGVANPDKVVAAGASYGGLQTLELAFANETIVEPNGYTLAWETNATPISLMAAIPEMTGTDLFSNIAPNGANSDSTLIPTGNPDVPVGNTNSHLAGLIIKDFNSGSQLPPQGSQDSFDTLLNALSAGQSAQSNPAITKVQTALNDFHSVLYDTTPATVVPIYALQGTTDLFFTPTYIQELINKLTQSDPSYPISVYYSSFGHSLLQVPVYFGQGYQLALNWLNSVMSSVVPSNNVTVAATGCDGSSDAVIFSGSTLSSLQTETLSLGYTTASDISPNTQSFDSGGPCSVPNPNLMGNTTNKNINSTIYTPQNGNLLFASDVNSGLSPEVLTGGVIVNATISNYGIDENLIAVLYDVSPSGKYTEITSGPYKINTVMAGTVSFELFPSGWALQPGHKLAVVLTQRSNQFSSDTVPTDVVNSLRSVSCLSSTSCYVLDASGELYYYDGTSFSGPYLIDPGNELTSISCTGQSTVSCMAVDNNGNSFSCTPNNCTSNPPVFTQTVINSGDALTSVSCLNSDCMAVDYVGNAFYYNGTSWTSPSIVSNYTLKSVSCTGTVIYCMAVDNNGNAYYCSSNNCTSNPPIFTQTGSTGVTDSINSISCISSGVCLAVDSLGNLLMYSSSVWGKSNIDPTNELTSISCVSSTSDYCTVSDYEGNVITGTYNTSWTTSSFIGADATSDTVGTFCTFSDPSCSIGNFITGISCPSLSFCMGIDASGYDFMGSMQTGTWNSPSQIIANETSFNKISCYNNSNYNYCVAVNSLGQADYYDGATGSWMIQSVDPGYSLTAVSCTTNTSVMCIAGDNNGDIYAMTISNGSPIWTFVKQVDTVNGAVYTIDSISCPSTSLCVAVDNVGNEIYSSTPTTSAWSIPTAIDSSNQINSISCPSTSFCVAVDNAGNEIYSSDPTGGKTKWSPTSIDSSNQINSVSCVPNSTDYSCAAVDNKGNLLSNPTADTSPSSWTSYANLFVNPDLTSISCAPGLTVADPVANCEIIDSHSDVFSTDLTYYEAFNSYSWTNLSNQGILDQSNDINSSIYPDLSCFNTSNASTANNFSCFSIDNAGNSLEYNGSSWSNTSGLSISNITLTIPEL